MYDGYVRRRMYAYLHMGMYAWLCIHMVMYMCMIMVVMYTYGYVYDHGCVCMFN